MVMVSLGFDILVCLLLAATIYHAIKLNRRINTLQEGSTQLQGLLKDFATATSTVEASVRSLKVAAAETVADLQQRIDAAQDMHAELTFIIESGNNLAERLSQAHTSTKGASGPAASAMPAKAEPAAAGAGARASRPAPEMDAAATSKPSSAASLPKRGAPTAALPSAPEASGGGGEGRSRAERELLRAMENRR